MEIRSPYHIYLDYKGFLIEERSYRVMPAPLMGTRFSTGRRAYTDLDFWQVGAMTDFSKGLNQKFLVDPSAFFYSIGIDCSKPGEAKLEKDLTDKDFDLGIVCSRYRTLGKLYLGTEEGKIISTEDGEEFVEEADTGEGRIYGFYEMDGKIFAMKGPEIAYVYDAEKEAWVEAEAPITGTFEFKNGSRTVTGTNSKILSELWPGALIKVYRDQVVGRPSANKTITVGGQEIPGWKYPSAAYKADNSYSYAESGDDESHCWYSFVEKAGVPISVPSNAVIKGIKVELKARGDGKAFQNPESYQPKIIVELTKNKNDPVGKSLYTPVLTTTGTVYTVGGENELWGTTWNPSDFGTDFGVICSRNIATGPETTNYYIDYIKVYVYWEPQDSGSDWYEIDEIVDDNQLILKLPFSGDDQIGTVKLALKDIYFAMVESDYGFAWFNDGIRRSIDGLTWLPIPPDPLWVVPSGEGKAVNAISITRGFLVGTERGLWLFVGGSSGINLWYFPDYANENNFAGMERWGHFGLFSIENQGIFYTDGVQTYPTNLNYLGEGISIVSCKSIASSGWDIFALVSDGTDWYLARCNMLYTKVPQYWWLVKKLEKEPAYLASFSNDELLIFYEDKSCQEFKKETGPYQKSGYLITSFIDEDLVRLQKVYKSISAILEGFDDDCLATLSYRFEPDEDFVEKTFEGKSQREIVFNLKNPTIENKIQLKIQLESNKPEKTPVLTDLCWTYILSSFSEDAAVKKNFFFTIICEDRLEKLTGTVEELGKEEPRTRQEILNEIWEISKKKGTLNFVGADNKRELGLIVEYSGSANSCLLTIDRTNFEITTIVDGEIDKTLDYFNKTIKEIADTINSWDGYQCVLHQDQDENRTAHDLEPVKDLEIKGSAYVYLGTDIHAVILNPQSPGQVKLALDGRGSDRVNMSLREA